MTSAANPDESERLTEAWKATEAGLPAGWRLDGTRCASTGLTPESRSDDWVAVAVGPDGAQRAHRAADPFTALSGLAAELGSR